MFIKIINIKTLIYKKPLQDIKIIFIKIINDLLFKTINVFRYIKINKKTLKSHYLYY